MISTSSARFLARSEFFISIFYRDRLQTSPSNIFVVILVPVDFFMKRFFVLGVLVCIDTVSKRSAFHPMHIW
jgi:hypothetical protein